MQVAVLQTLADEKCLHLMPSLNLAILDQTAYTGQSTIQGQMSRQQAQSGHQNLQQVLKELHHSSLLEKCHVTGSLVKDL